MNTLCFMWVCTLGSALLVCGQEFLLAAISSGSQFGICKYEGDWSCLQNIANFTNDAYVVGFDDQTLRVFWNDRNKRLIYSSQLNGHGVKVVANYTRSRGTQTEIGGLAVDGSSGLVYFTEILEGSIHVLHSDSGKEAVILLQEAEAPSDIELDVIGRKIFWSDYGAEPSVWRADSDGTFSQKLANAYPWNWPAGIYFKESEQVLYVCNVLLERQDTQLVRINLNDDTAVLWTLVNGVCRDLEGNNSHIFMSESTGLWILDGKTPANRQKVQGFSDSFINGIDYYKYSPAIHNPCSTVDCGVKKLCIPRKEGFTRCACLKGFTGSSCSEVVPPTTHPAFAFSEQGGLYGLVGYPETFLRTRLFQGFFLHWPIELGSAVAIDSHKEIAYVYTLNKHSIVQMNLNSSPGSFYKTISNSIPFTAGLTLDWTVGILYLAVDTPSLKAIYFMDIAGVRLTKLVTGNMLQPRGLAVDPGKGIVVWCDAALGRVERVATDGSDRRVLQQLPGATSVVINYAVHTLLVAAESGVYSMYDTGHSVSKIIDVSSQNRRVLSVDFHSGVIMTIMQAGNKNTSFGFFNMDQSHTPIGEVNFTGNALTVKVNHKDRQPGKEKSCAALQCTEFCISSSLGTGMCVCPNNPRTGCPAIVFQNNFATTPTVALPITSSTTGLTSSRSWARALSTEPAATTSQKTPSTTRSLSTQTIFVDGTEPQQEAWLTPVTAGVVVFGVIVVSIVIAAIICNRRQRFAAYNRARTLQVSGDAEYEYATPAARATSVQAAPYDNCTLTPQHRESHNSSIYLEPDTVLSRTCSMNRGPAEQTEQGSFSLQSTNTADYDYAYNLQEREL